MDIYVQKDGQQHGPFPEAKIRQGIDEGEFGPDDLAWTTGKASWQSLSSLINLDVTKPPPIHVVAAAHPTSNLATPVDLFPDPVVLQKETMVELTSFPQPVPAPPKASGPFCKNCGTPYNRWSLFHSLGSGLCRLCAKTHVKTEPAPIWDREVKTNDDAYKVIRFTAIWFIVCAIINFCMGFVWMPILVLCCVAGLWHFQSRTAAILLIGFSGLDILLVLLLGSGIGMMIGEIIGFIELALSFHSLEAVRKLRNGFAKKSE